MAGTAQMRLCLPCDCRAVGRPAEKNYLIAPKRLSNEFDETIGAEPATWVVAAAGAAAWAGVSDTEGFS
jgi:hypothetical protein